MEFIETIEMMDCWVVLVKQELFDEAVDFFFNKNQTPDVCVFGVEGRRGFTFFPYKKYRGCKSWVPPAGYILLTSYGAFAERGGVLDIPIELTLTRDDYHDLKKPEYWAQMPKKFPQFFSGSVYLDLEYSLEGGLRVVGGFKLLKFLAEHPRARALAPCDVSQLARAEDEPPFVKNFVQGGA